MKTMKTTHLTFFIFRIVAVVFYGIVLLTMFIPMISLDQYVEYEFYEVEYIGKYESYSLPLATKIAPLDLMKNVTLDEDDVKAIKTQYRNLKSSLDKKLKSGEITEDEYFTMLAEDPITNTYYVSVIYDGTADFARIQDKLTLISIVAIVIYAFAAILLLFNIFNLVFNAKFIYITNAQASWIYTVATLIYVIYIFATSLTNYHSYGADDAVKEITMICLSANGTYITLIIFEAVYSVVSLIMSAKFNKTYTYIEEVPEFISYRIKQETKKPYMMPEQTNKKPKAYYTKKHKKKKKKKHGKKH